MQKKFTPVPGSLSPVSYRIYIFFYKTNFYSVSPPLGVISTIQSKKWNSFKTIRPILDQVVTLVKAYEDL